MKTLFVWKPILMALMMSLLAGTVSAKTVTPMTSSANVGEVRDSEFTVLPTIDWGGEYTMVYANGNAKRTKPDSILGKLGVKFDLWRENDPHKMLDAYISGRTPYFRGTFGMVMQALPEMKNDPRTEPVGFIVLTNSAGGDTLVVTSKIKTIADIKRVALQANGPHLEFWYELLKMAGRKLSDVQIVWTDTLSGPAEALRKGQADAAFCIIPDALALTAKTTIANAEGSLAGSRILLSTKTYNKVIYDVYVVRRDYFEAHREEVYALTQGLLQSQDKLTQVFKDKKSAEYRATVSAFTEVALGGEQPVTVGEEMILDFNFARFSFNEKFFNEQPFPSFTTLTANVQKAFLDYGLLTGKVTFDHAHWDWAKLRSGAKLQVQAEAPTFNASAVAAVVTQRAAKGQLVSGQLFPTFKIGFKPNQNDFPVDLYRTSYDKVIEDLSKLGGAVVVIEGHADAMKYLREKKNGAPQHVVSRLAQEAKNLSLQRATQVRAAMIDYAKGKGVRLDESQFTVLGHGFDKPANGKSCGSDPCPPGSEQEWLDNMRVEFRIIELEAEEAVWKPL